MPPRSAFALTAWLVAVTACAAAADDPPFSETGGSGGEGGTGGAAPGSGGATSTSSGSGGDDIDPPPQGGGYPGGPAEVFGQSATVLYRLDPETKVVDTIGPFQGCAAVIDIALDKESTIYAASYSALYTVDKKSAACTLVATGTFPNSLSFVPKGTVDPDVEALVGYQGDVYQRIDTTTGAVQNIGNLGGGFVSSGDIVSVDKGGTFLTVKGNGCGDCLVEVNPTTGALVKNWGAVGHASVFGLAFWAGSVYGFSNAGELFEIQFQQDSIFTTIITVPGAPGDLSYWGAGSTTAAPPAPPPS